MILGQILLPFQEKTHRFILIDETQLDKIQLGSAVRSTHDRIALQGHRLDHDDGTVSVKEDVCA